MDVYIDNEEISEFVFKALTDKGMVPTEDETDMIADILFDFLIHKEVITEEEFE